MWGAVTAEASEALLGAENVDRLPGDQASHTAGQFTAIVISGVGP